MGVEMKTLKLILYLVQHWNRRPIININGFYQLVLGQFSSFWLPYAGIVLRPSPYSVIYFQQVIVSLSIFCCKYSLVALVRNRFYLLTHSLTHSTSAFLFLKARNLILSKGKGIHNMV